MQCLWKLAKPRVKYLCLVRPDTTLGAYPFNSIFESIKKDNKRALDCFFLSEWLRFDVKKKKTKLMHQLKHKQRSTFYTRLDCFDFHN